MYNYVTVIGLTVKCLLQEIKQIVNNSFIITNVIIIIFIILMPNELISCVYLSTRIILLVLLLILTSFSLFCLFGHHICFFLHMVFLTDKTITIIINIFTFYIHVGLHYDLSEHKGLRRSKMFLYVQHFF